MDIDRSAGQGSGAAGSGERSVERQMNEFIKFPKIARYSRECIVTEKIDGTNASIFIEAGTGRDAEALYVSDGLAMYAGSRKRWITPENDNAGFARWVLDHADELLALGPGRHFGEWWGSKIQRTYGLVSGDKRFSMFNTIMWCLHSEEPKEIPTGDPRVTKMQTALPECVGLVPLLWRGDFAFIDVEFILVELRTFGSKAAPGFMNPEGIVIYHTAGNVSFKKTIKGDDVPKSLQ